MKSETKKLHIIYISIIVILVVVFAGGIWYVHNKSERFGYARSGQQMMRGRAGGQGGAMGGMGMTQVTPPAETDQQKQQLTDGTSTATTQKTFNITAGNFYFVPSKITVNKGDQVTFVLTNAGGVHNLVIDELGVKMAMTRTAQGETATFSASKSGSFVYYCSVPGHKAKGMWGTLVVQ
ncbi:MAG: plastocyanin/azurin family copper-binding protein [Candidatus Levyibacteriota bacterium]